MKKRLAIMCVVLAICGIAITGCGQKEQQGQVGNQNETDVNRHEEWQKRGSVNEPEQTRKITNLQGKPCFEKFFLPFFVQ